MRHSRGRRSVGLPGVGAEHACGDREALGSEGCGYQSRSGLFRVADCFSTGRRGRGNRESRALRDHLNPEGRADPAAAYARGRPVRCRVEIPGFPGIVGLLAVRPLVSVRPGRRRSVKRHTPHCTLWTLTQRVKSRGRSATAGSPHPGRQRWRRGCARLGRAGHRGGRDPVLPGMRAPTQSAHRPRRSGWRPGAARRAREAHCTGAERSPPNATVDVYDC